MGRLDMRFTTGSMRTKKFFPGGLKIPVFFLLALVAGLSTKAQQYCLTFEQPREKSQAKTEGGGHGGGKGVCAFVSTGQTDFARSGSQALRLMIWDEGNCSAVSWATFAQVYPCTPGRKIHAGAWLYFSSAIFPLLDERATVQLRVEYFTDAEATQINPQHVRVSSPFSPTVGFVPDSWHLVETFDRAPENTRAMKLTIMLCSEVNNGCRQAVWADDVFVEFSGPKPRNDLWPDKYRGLACRPSWSLACLQTP